MIGSADFSEVRRLKNQKPAQGESFINHLSGVVSVLGNLMRSYK